MGGLWLWCHDKSREAMSGKESIVFLDDPFPVMDMEQPTDQPMKESEQEAGR